MNIEFEKRNADRLLKNSFLFNDPWAMEPTIIEYKFETDIDWNINPFNDPEWTFMLSRHDFVLKLAQVGDYLNDSKYLIKSKELMFDFISRAPLTSDSKATSWRSIDSAIRIKNWLSSFNILKKHNILDKKSTDIFIKSVKLHSVYLSKIDNTFTRQSNWGIIGDSGLFVTSLFLNDLNLTNLALNRLIVEIKNQILDDGFHWEQSPMYHVEVLLSIFDVIEAAKIYNIQISEIIIKTAIKMSFAIVKSQKPNHHQLLQSDSDDTDLRDILSKAAILFNNGIFKFFATNRLSYPYTQEQIELYDNIEIEFPNFKSTQLEESGNYYFRTGWNEDDNFLHFFCGDLGSGHGHSNLLHFDLTYGKEDIIVDSGRFTYMDCKERHDLKSTKYHNSIMIDNIDYCSVRDTWSYKSKPTFIKGEYIEKENYKFVSGINTSYLNINSSLVERKILQLNKELILIFDNITCNNKHTVNRFFHFDNKGYLEQKDNYIYFNKSNITATMYFEKESNISIQETFYSKHYNKMESKPSLNIENIINQNTSLLSIISINNSNLSVEELTVKSMSFDTIFTKDKVRAFSITQTGHEPYLVLFSQTQCLDGVDMFKAKSLEGYGKTLIYHDNNLTKIQN